MTTGAQAQAAERAAVEVARGLGLFDPVQLLRSGANHVYRVGHVVLRVTAGDVDVMSQIALARLLADEGIPVLRPLTDVVAVGDVQVTVWEYIDSQQPLEYRRWGEAIALLHGLVVSRVAEHVQLPWCGDAAWLQLRENLERAARAGVVSDEDIAVLREAADQLSGWQDKARGEQLVVCHGDVHPQNVLMRGDDLVILDWDAVCLGPAAWDHAALLTWGDRWGGNPDDYSAFADGYGADLRESAVGQVLADVRLLAPTINMIIKGAASQLHATEAQVRMRYWRGDVLAPSWTPQ